MHFLLTAIGSYGDVHPMVGLGAQLARRGHRVSVVANPYFADVVHQAGLELLPLLSADDYHRLIEYPHLWHPLRAVPFLLREGVVNLLRPLYELLAANYVPNQTVLVAHPLDAASRLLRETSGAPVAAVVLSPQVLWSDHRPPVMGPAPIGPHMPAWLNNLQFWIGNRLLIDPVLKRPLDRFRRELGLGPAPRLFPTWWFTTDQNICLFPDWFAPPQPDWPRPLAQVGFPLWDAGEATGLPAQVEQFLAAGTPPIVLVAGTANRQAADFFRTAVDVCRRLARRGILLTRFPDQVPPSLPTEVRHFDFVPLTQLLPRCAAIVHHGGIGTSSQALAAGVPQLVRPLAFDQFDNADRLCRLGVARELRPARFTAARAVDALRPLLESPDVAHRCQSWAERCHAAPALPAACDLLEQLANRSRAR